jgi:hypothetical protein
MGNMMMMSIGVQWCSAQLKLGRQASSFNESTSLCYNLPAERAALPDDRKPCGTKLLGLGTAFDLSSEFSLNSSDALCS